MSNPDQAVTDHLNALREVELACAIKKINDHYDQRIKGGTPERLGRRIFDRRNNSYPDRQKPFADMQDINLRLSVDR
jgi:hypothetical protein